MRAEATAPGSLFTERLKDRLRDPIHGLQRRTQSRWHARDLRSIHDRTAAIRPGQVLLFAALRNEAIRLPSFLRHYRGLGVDHFLLVDNGSSDGFQSLVAEATDISTWYTDASYRDANYGMHWLNALLDRYGRGHWCLTCDLDEWLIYPNHDTRTLHELGAFLESEGRESFSCLMLDMYGDRAPAETRFDADDDPRLIAPWFDACGYVQQRGVLGETRTQGGPRRRLLYGDDPTSAPVLNKTPFVRWQRGFRYFLSMHQLVPSRLNSAHPEGFNAPTGCLLHFKYFSSLTDKIQEELDRKQHFDNAAEYRRYAERKLDQNGGFHCSATRRLEHWQQLVELGLMNRGRWF